MPSSVIATNCAVHGAQHCLLSAICNCANFANFCTKLRTTVTVTTVVGCKGNTRAISIFWGCRQKIQNVISILSEHTPTNPITHHNTQTKTDTHTHTHTHTHTPSHPNKDSHTHTHTEESLCAQKLASHNHIFANDKEDELKSQTLRIADKD